MTENELSARIAAAVGDVDLSDAEIPGIDLYLDQILSLVSEKNAASAPRYKERPLTKTMVSNYSKDGLISPISGKKYSRAHIVEMLLVYNLKKSLSIEEIKRVLTGVREGCGFSGDDLVAAYHRFLSIKEENRARAGEAVKRLLESDKLDPADDKDFFLLLLDILSLSSYLNEIGHELLESRYAAAAELERERREREEAEKRERKEREEAEKRERKEREETKKRERKEEADKSERRRRDAEIRAAIEKLQGELTEPETPDAPAK